LGYRIVIPARFASTRLPGKPLLPIAGRPMIQHVIARARESRAEEVVVATDDESDRVAEVLERRAWPDDTVVVNLQGDEPAMPPCLLDQVAEDMEGHEDASVTTLAHGITDMRTLFDPHVVKVVTDRAGYALYFSRAPIPWHRDEFTGVDGSLPEDTPFLRHIGLYAYRAGFLRRYVAWDPAPLERAESLEQLRVLWHGGRIHVSRARVEPGAGVDTRADLERMDRLLGSGR